MGLAEPKKKKDFLKKIPGVYSATAPPFANPVTTIDDVSGSIERNLSFISENFDDNEIALQAKKITDYLHKCFPFTTKFVLLTDDGKAPTQKSDTHALRKKGNVDEEITKRIIADAKNGTAISRENIDNIIPTIAKKKTPNESKTGWAQFHESRVFRNFARDGVLLSLMDNVSAAKHIFTYYHGSLKSASESVQVEPCVGEADIKFGHIFVSEFFANDDLIISSRDSDIPVIFFVVRQFIPRERQRHIFWYDGDGYYNLTRVADTYPNSVALAIAFMQSGTDYILNSCIKNEEEAFLATYNAASSMNDFDASRIAQILDVTVKKLPHKSQAPLSKTAQQLWWNLVYWRNCENPSDEDQAHSINELGIGRKMLHLRATTEAQDKSDEQGGRGEGDCTTPDHGAQND